MGENKKIILSQFWVFSILAILFWPIFSTAQESLTLNPPLPDCLGSQAFVNLNWTSDIAGSPTFYILRKIQGELDFSEIASTQNTYYTDQGIESDKNYVYKIKAVGEIDTFFSNEATASAAYCPPVLSPPITSCLADGPRISLSWSSVSGNLLKYEVYRDGVKIGETTNTTLDDGPNLEGTKTYNYFIRAVWQDGNSSNSDEVSVAALACRPTLTVIADCLSNTAPGGPKIELSWNSLLGVQNYQIYRKVPTETIFSLFKTTNETNYTDNLVESFPNYWQGGQISYYVKAIWLTEQKDSAIQTVAIPRCPPFLTVESNCDEFSFRLSWTATLEATHYNIYRNGQFLYQNIGTTATDYNDYLTLDLCPDQICSFSYQIEAMVTGLPSFPSNSVEKSIDCATVLPPSPAPVLNPLEVYCRDNDSKIKISWSPSDNVIYYGLYRNNVHILNLLETSYEDGGIESGIEYTYFVIAYGKEESIISDNTQTQIAVSCVPPSASSFSLTPVCEDGKPEVNLSWTETTNTEAYEIWRDPSATDLSLIITFDKTTPEFISRNWNDSDVSPSSSYYYKVVSRGPTGVPPTSSDIKSINTLSCLPTTPALNLTTDCLSGNPVVNLSWTTDGANTSRYEIFREDWSLTTPIRTIYDVSVKNWQDTSVVPETSYNYKVEAVGYGESPARASSGYKSITTDNCSAPGSFTLNEPFYYCQGSYPWAELSWTESSNSTSYNLNRLLNQPTTFYNVNSPYIERGMGNALSFDGYYDYVNIPDAVSLSPTRITLESWVYPTEFVYYGNIFNKRSPEQYILRLYSNTGRVQAYIHSGGAWRACTTPSNIAVSLNKWNHLIFTYDGGAGRVYVNGQLGCSFSYTGNIASGTNSLKIGSYHTSATTSERFKGIIDNVRIYSRALSATEISEHYQTIYSNETGLIGLWRFDEGTGQIVSDSSNFGNNGTLGGSSATETYDPTWIQNGIQSGTQYSWQAEAVGPGGSTFSNTTNPNTMPVCPPTKPGLVLDSFCSAENDLPNVSLRWSYAISTLKYEIYREDVGLIKTINQGDAEFTSRTWTDNNNGLGLSENTDYTYYVKAIGSGGENQSDSIVINTPGCDRPTQPQDLEVNFSCSGSYPRININWTASENTTSYTIYRSPTGSPFPVSTTLTSYTDTAVNVNTNYSYYVIAYGPAGASDPSEEVSITTGYCPPSTPSITLLTTDCENQDPINNISWSDATTFNTLEYKIYRNTVNSPPAEPITSVSVGTLNWKDNLGHSPLTAYYYWVKAIGPAGESSLSASKSVVTYSCGLTPAAPTLSLDELYCLENLPYADFSWNNVDNAYSYNLYRTNFDSSQSIYSTRLSPLTDKGTNSLSFDGSNDYVEVPNSDSLNPTEITMEAWVYPTKFVYYGNIVNKRYPAQYILRLYYNTGRVQAYIYSGGWRSCTTGTSTIVSLNQWNHVVATFNGSTLRVFVNGSQGCYLNYSGEINSGTSILKIGSYYTSATTSERFNGDIDEVRIYSRALSDSEVAEHYNGVYNNEAGLRGVWHFDEGTGITAYDQSGLGNDGTLYNGPAWQEDSPNAIKVLPLERSKDYQYKVKAFGADTESNFSNEISFTALSCLPAKPDLKVSPQCEEDDSLIELSWQADDLTSYWSIYKGREETTPAYLTDTTLTSYFDDDVESGINYTYYVVARGKGVDVFSDAITKTALFCHNPPYGGSSFSISASSICLGYAVRNKIEWPSDTTGNTIFYDIWGKNITLDETEFSLIYSGLSADTTQYFDIVEETNVYIYQVEAKGSGSGNAVFSDESNEVTAKECFNTFPDAPYLSLNLVWSVDHLIVVSIGWTDAGNEEEYKVFRSASGLIEIATLDEDVLNYVDYTVTDGQTYEYQVMALNKNGSTLSNIITVEIPIARPGDFTLGGQMLSVDQIYLWWDEALTSEAGGEVTYEIRRSSSSNCNPEDLDDCTSQFNSYTFVCSTTALECYDNSPDLSQRYYIARATNNAENPTYSQWIKIGFSLPIWKEIAPW